MVQIILGLLLLALSVVLLTGLTFGGQKVKKAITVPSGLVSLALAVFMFGSTSYYHVEENHVLHLHKIYGGDSLTEGAIIALDGEKGPQAEIMREGFHFSPFLRVINNTTQLPIVDIPAGYYGRISTKDGQPLPDGAIMADTWSDEEFGKMLDAGYFLRNGGQKGLQASVLKPGKHPINLFLYTVEYGNGDVAVVFNQDGVSQVSSNLDTRVTEVPAGHVAVVKSNLTEADRVCVETEESTARVEGALSAPLVPEGCKGIWKDPLLPGAYFLNRNAYEATIVDTRVQTWQYKGGFTKRQISLEVGMDGSIVQTPSTTVIEHNPQRHADRAIFVKVEGWDVPQEVRVVVQVSPENAPIVVASVGDLQAVEDRILTPAIRSIVRNVVGSTITYDETNEDGETQSITRATRVLDLIENRGVLEQNVENLVDIEARKAGVDLKEVRFGEPAIPPELLVARQREQLSNQLAKAFAEERKAQNERVKTEQAKATADQQPKLVEAQIQVEVSKQYMEERENRGTADKRYLEQLAEGQKAQALVLGEDRVMVLQLSEKVIAALQEKPELIGLVGKLVPHTVVTESGSGLAGPAAILSGVLGKNDDGGQTSLGLPKATKESGKASKN